MIQELTTLPMMHMHTLYISYLYNPELQLVCDNICHDIVLKWNPWSRLGTDHSATGPHSMDSGDDGFDCDAEPGGHQSTTSAAAAAAAAARNRMISAAGVHHWRGSRSSSRLALQLS